MCPGADDRGVHKKLQVLRARISCQRRGASRLFLLDMLLGNPDRLPCEALGWRGNPHNILFAAAGARAGRMVAIDSAVQRRPPGASRPSALAGSVLHHLNS